MRRRAGMRRVGRPGLVGTMARTAVISSTATATSMAVGNRMSSSQQRKAQAAYQQDQMAELQAQQEQLAYQQQAMAEQPVRETEVVDDLDAQLVQIQKLSVLLDQGILTEEEFQAKKRQILGI